MLPARAPGNGSTSAETITGYLESALARCEWRPAAQTGERRLRSVEIDGWWAPGLGEALPAGVAVGKDPVCAFLVPVRVDRAGEFIHLVVAVRGLGVQRRVEPRVVDVVAIGIHAGKCRAASLGVEDGIGRPADAYLGNPPNEIAVHH